MVISAVMLTASGLALRAVLVTFLPNANSSFDASELITLIASSVFLAAVSLPAVLGHHSTIPKLEAPAIAFLASSIARASKRESRRNGPKRLARLLERRLTAKK